MQRKRGVDELLELVKRMRFLLALKVGRIPGRNPHRMDLVGRWLRCLVENRNYRRQRWLELTEIEWTQVVEEANVFPQLLTKCLPLQLLVCWIKHRLALIGHLPQNYFFPPSNECQL